MEHTDSTSPRELERRREQRDLIQEIVQVQQLTASIKDRMQRLRLLEEDIDLANAIVSSITARMRKLEVPDDPT